jgi:hypothetical protein
VRLVQAFGLERVHEPYIEHIEGPMIPAEESFAASRKRPKYEKAYNAIGRSSRWWRRSGRAPEPVSPSSN